MQAILVQNMREKYAEFGKICAKICGITEISGVNDAHVCVYVGQKCAEMLKNAIAYAEICEICDYMRIFA